MQKVITVLLTLGAILLCARLSSATEDTWAAKTGMSTSRVFHGASAVQGKVYVFGGQREGGADGITSVEEYDPRTDQWRARADMPSARLGMSVSTVNDKCYLIGGARGPGRPGLQLVQEYDPKADSWRRRADMPTARAAGASAVIDGKIYVAGGWEEGDTLSSAVDSLEIYDPDSDSWTVGAPLPTPRALLAAGAVGGQLYAMGGGSSALGGFDSSLVERYDPQTDTWDTPAPMNTPRGAFAAAVVNGRIFVAGGGALSATPLATQEAYDPSSDSWSAMATMPTARWGAVGGIVGGTVYVLGGSTETGVGHNSLATNEAYEAGGFRINPGINDAWLNIATAGQGFFIIVFPDTGIVFLAWFTYDTALPPEDVEALLGAAEHRWLTAQGPYDGDTATLDVFLTEGGIFDMAEPAPITGESIGTMIIKWTDCENGVLSYDIDPPGVMGEIPIQRIVPDNVALCEALANP